MTEPARLLTRKPLFFVVDDDAVTRLMLCRFLEKIGYLTMAMSDGAEAVAAFDEHLPDIVLMDAKMPSMNGFDACALMKGRPGGERVPVLMITGLNDDESVDRAYQAGAADFITKPIHWAILRNRVGYLLQHIESERRLFLASSVYENTNEGIVVTDPDGHIQSVNPAFTRITGYGDQEVLGRNLRLLKSGRHDAAFYRRFWESLTETGRWQGEFWNRRKDGTIYPQWSNVNVIRGPDGKPRNYVSVFSDLTVIKESEENLRYLLGHDTLTDLPNRHLFQERLSFALAEAKGLRRMVAILLLDLDRFKVINDTMGHDTGDRLLVQVGERLRSALEGLGILGRMGGDEFGFIVPKLTHAEGAVQAAQAMLKALSVAFVIDGMDYFIGGSIGIGVYPLDGEDVKTLVKNADAAMYHAKEQGRNNFQFYRDTLNTTSMARMLMEGSLRNALDKGEFFLCYQPQMDLATGRLIGAEALIRWQHPLQGTISPGEFIPLAEETGLIIPMGLWALETACRQARSWQDQGFPPVRMAVNLSGIQFRQPDFTSQVTGVLEATGLETSRLELELTESIAMGDVEETFLKLNTLSDAEVKLAIDDFGTGFSSLSYLKRFPIDTLKIDQSFVRNCTTDPEDAAIIRTFIGLAHSLGLSVIAEGVETVEQLEFLKSHNCNEIQGYHYSRPLKTDDFADFMRRHLQPVPAALPGSGTA